MNDFAYLCRSKTASDLYLIPSPCNALATAAKRIIYKNLWNCWKTSRFYSCFFQRTKGLNASCSLNSYFFLKCESHVLKERGTHRKRETGLLSTGTLHGRLHGPARAELDQSQKLETASESFLWKSGNQVLRPPRMHDSRSCIGNRDGTQSQGICYRHYLCLWINCGHYMIQGQTF